MQFSDLFKIVKQKKILHTTHINPDCDGIASIYWGINVFGGDYYIPKITLRTTKGLVKKLNLSDNQKKDFTDYDFVFIYDTEMKEHVNFIPKNKPYVLFDHHHMRDKEFIKNSLFSYISESSANVVNLYELSREFNIVLNDYVLFSFAIALYTDTIMFKTARKQEFVYFSKFLTNHRFEDITDTIYSEEINWKKFKKCLNKLEIIQLNNLNIGISDFESENIYYSFIESLFDVITLDVLIGILPQGLKIHMKKKHIQKIYHKLLIPLQKELNIKRFQGFWHNFFDYKKILEKLKEYDNS
ncbi:DHH family phosphoesterase [Thermosipho atlanticus]|uniref:DHH family protein n=1 Tax=Thermosipho atlanticus DSM 15807 TaxID=1123380 RepID=A0A1M5S339_9BACT|nr:phosphoesterase [Thermosipho atlanticus]SHH32850.1 hypothetical protein SAMN02745199_0772 [Thermosipho atlanticus DSM 15807]